MIYERLLGYLYIKLLRLRSYKQNSSEIFYSHNQIHSEGPLRSFVTVFRNPPLNPLIELSNAFRSVPPPEGAGGAGGAGGALVGCGKGNGGSSIKEGEGEG